MPRPGASVHDRKAKWGAGWHAELMIRHTGSPTFVIMERMAWTDERLDDFSRRMDAGFERIDRRFEHLETRIDRRFEVVHEDMREIRGEITAVRVTLMRVGGGIMAGLVGVIAAVLARGI